MRGSLASISAFVIGMGPLVAFAQTDAAVDAPAATPAASLLEPALTAAEPGASAAPVAAGPAAPAAPAAPVAPVALSPSAASPSAPPITFTWEALVDAYYLYNFTGKPSTQGPALPRQFDLVANSFSLSYVKLGVGADTQYVAFRVDLGAGHTAAIINAASSITSPSDRTTVAGALASSQYGNAFLVQQAFATLKPTKWLSLDAGRFVTTASAEVIEANKNWLYSRSMLFYGVPTLHTGVRVNVTVNPSLKLQASLVNGWNNDPDNNIGKTFGANATYAPPDSGLNASVTTYIGKELTAGSGGETTILLDGVLSKDIAKASVGLNVDYLRAGVPYWVGAALMGKYAFTDLLNLAARFEVLSSKQGGFTAVFPVPTPYLGDAILYEGTLMGGLVVAKHFETRLELRGDFANQDLFDKGGTPRRNQFTGLVAFLAYF